MPSYTPVTQSARQLNKAREEGRRETEQQIMKWLREAWTGTTIEDEVIAGIEAGEHWNEGGWS